MESSIQFYFTKGLAPSTQRAYRSGQQRYIKYCAEAGYTPTPVEELKLCGFVARLADEHLKHRTIKAYLSAVRHLQISEGLPDPFHSSVGMPKLHYVLRGIKKHEAEVGSGPRERLPVTPDILLQIRAVWEPSGASWSTKLLWAACGLAFFGFMRAGELVAPSATSHDPSIHLCMADIAFDSSSAPSTLRVSIKQSKTDPFRQGIQLLIGKTGTKLCPVAAMLDFLRVRGTSEGFLFRFEDGSCLTRQRLVEAVRAALGAAGLDQSRYCGHSFRIGAATEAAKKGIEDSVIKTLGRWKSLAYLDYVKIPRSDLVHYSAVLAS